MEREDRTREKTGKKAVKARRREENATQQTWREPLNAALALGRKGDWSAAYDWIEPYRHLDGWREFRLHVKRYAVKRAEAATGKPWPRMFRNPTAQQDHVFRTAAIEYALLEIRNAEGSFPVVGFGFDLENEYTRRTAAGLIGSQILAILWFSVRWWQGDASVFEKILAVASPPLLLYWVLHFIKAPSPAPDWSLPP